VFAYANIDYYIDGQCMKTYWLLFGVLGKTDN